MSIPAIVGENCLDVWGLDDEEDEEVCVFVGEDESAEVNACWEANDKNDGTDDEDEMELLVESDCDDDPEDDCDEEDGKVIE